MKKLNDTQLRILERSKIRCVDVMRLMGDYTEDDLGVTLKARVDTHIRTCPRCSHLQQSYQATVELANTLGYVPVPRDVQNRLRRALNDRLGLELPLL